ncbi:MAG: hypothetical protein A2Y17_13405 [Clostridiales bacterium GWF2_38_85]|nr:MAG: hypothetical protein A2Y17_13405 [Clostridiales bacterium GWF2_38_85]
MNKTAIKNYAVAARRELIAAVCQKAYQYGIQADKALPVQEVQGGFILNGVTYSKKESDQRKQLISTISSGSTKYADGYKQVMEEVAYTWFNRLIALRYMEVKEYLPSGVRILSSINEERLEPDCIREAGRLDYIDQKVAAEFTSDEARYRYILIAQCNALADIMPRMFEKISDYTELLLPDKLYIKDGIVYNLVHGISAEDFGEQVEIIGWLYQYYISEKKGEVFAALKNNVKITKENIPAATQLFTPDWIVKYMVENSLGRLWLDKDKNESGLTNEYMNASFYGWKYYLEDAEQTPEVAERLRVLHGESTITRPEEIKFIDPCMGSGHILVYAFDMLYQIYKNQGYAERDIPNLILEKNIFGLDIDERACQLAYFALMMKARGYNRRFFRQDNVPQPQVYSPIADNDLLEYGSLIKIDTLEPKPAQSSEQLSLDDMQIAAKLNDWHFKQLIMQRYDVVVTNPPYMGNMPAEMTEYVINKYPDSRYDMYSVFIEKCIELTKKSGFVAMITQHTWMFISSFERLRTKIVQYDWMNLAHLGTRAFEEIGGEVVQTAAFVIRKAKIESYRSIGVRLVGYDNAETKEAAFLKGNDIHIFTADNFGKLPGIPFVYWLSDNYYTPFDCAKTIDWYVEKKAGIVTGNDPYFVRLWFEPKYSDISFIGLSDYSKYHIMQKGGGFRRYYGNNEYTIRLSDLYIPSKTNVSVRRGDADYYFKKAIGWSQVGNAQKSFRAISNSICGTATPTIYLKNEKLFGYILAFLNTKVAFQYLAAYNPTINLLTTDICNIPLFVIEEKIEDISDLTASCIAISRTDWDSFETSWDFKTHPLITARGNYEETQPLEVADDIVEGVVVTEWSKTSPPISQAFDAWERETDSRFITLKSNEEELNRIFITIYGLQDELTPEVEDKDVSIRRADRIREVKSLISYAVGCMFGRYSLDEDGLIYAGGNWDISRYKGYIPEDDNIIPITDADYFNDDIVVRFVEFIKTVYSEQTLGENLDFIADTLYPTGGGTSREKIRRYFLNDFYKDHLKTYQKKPIYWMFDSGKESGFKALVYLHRYDKYTVARVRTDYLHPLQRKYEAEIGRLDMLSGLLETKPNEKAAYQKQKESIRKKAAECVAYDQAIAHIANQAIELDLDDGVTVNYAKFQNIEVPQGDGRGVLIMNLLSQI